MPRIQWMAAFVVALTFGATAAAPVAAAQVRELRCPFTERKWEAKLTIDYGARTMTVEQLDGDAVSPGFGFRNIPATVTDDYITGEMRRGIAYYRYSLNRYSGVLMQMADHGAGTGVQNSAPCVPFQRGPRRY